jgi:hypothetical protein
VRLRWRPRRTDYSNASPMASVTRVTGMAIFA